MQNFHVNFPGAAFETVAMCGLRYSITHANTYLRDQPREMCTIHQYERIGENIKSVSSIQAAHKLSTVTFKAKYLRHHKFIEVRK